MNFSNIGKWLVSIATISFLFSGQAFSQELEAKHASVPQVKQILDEDFVGFLVKQERLRWTMETITKVASDLTMRQNGEPPANEDVHLRARFKSSLGTCILKSGILEYTAPTEEMNLEIETAIANDIAVSDFRLIRSYYDTENGNRFREFLNENGKIVSSIWESAISLADYVDDEPPELREPFPPKGDSDSELREVFELMSLSRQMQIFKMLAKHDTGDASAMASIGFVHLAYVYHRDDFKKLGKKYQKNLNSFKIFVNSRENEHLVTAMINVAQRDLLRPDMSDIADLVSTITRSGSVDCPASIMP